MLIFPDFGVVALSFHSPRTFGFHLLYQMEVLLCFGCREVEVSKPILVDNGERLETAARLIRQPTKDLVNVHLLCLEMLTDSRLDTNFC